MKTPRRLALCLLGSAFLLSTVGCGGRSDLPELGRVRGTVTLDGRPLAGAIVRFFPDSGRPATATLDAAGKYDLIYTHDVYGANVGPNTVSFAWPDGQRGSVPIPSQYGAGSELKVIVASGDNTFDFPLKSK